MGKSEWAGVGVVSGSVIGKEKKEPVEIICCILGHLIQ